MFINTLRNSITLEFIECLSQILQNSACKEENTKPVSLISKKSLPLPESVYLLWEVYFISTTNLFSDFSLQKAYNKANLHLVSPRAFLIHLVR